MIRAEGLGKRLGGRTVLEGVDLSLEAGEVTLFMGPNGQGKTVLLCCLSGALRPSAGRALVAGLPAGEAPAAVSLLQQGSVGLPALSARENARFYGLLHPAATGRWSALLDRFELDERDRVLRHCSAGMRRKAELAIALDRDVPAYLLDEPTAALDLGTVRALHRELRRLADSGRAVVLTSHAPIDAALADRLVFIRDGRVTADGSPDALRAALPPVVRVRGTVHSAGERLAGRLLIGHHYGAGAELRGVLRPGRTLAEVREALADLDATAEIDEPTAVDLYERLAAGD